MSDNNAGLYNEQGIHLTKDAFVVIIKTAWNATIVNALEEGAIKILQEKQIAFQTITIPGAFEIPFTIKHYWESSTKKPAAFIALGTIIRGDTSHFEYVCKAVTDGVLQLNLSLPVPTIFGVLTVENELQAKARIGGKHGHKGEEAALTAIQMIALTSRKL
ncbi:MAG: 6,7-dimethyl-8-ribityllumazine synthase [Chitinophagaceae bacterium]